MEGTYIAIYDLRRIKKNYSLDLVETVVMYLMYITYFF